MERLQKWRPRPTDSGRRAHVLPVLIERIRPAARRRGRRGARVFRFGGGWNPEVVAGGGTTMSAPSITANDIGPLIAVQGPPNRLYFYWAYDGSGVWNWQVPAGLGTTFSAPSIVENNGSVNIAAQGPGNFLDFYWQADGSPTWHPEVVPNGTAFSQPAPSALLPRRARARPPAATIGRRRRRPVISPCVRAGVQKHRNSRH
jgi:hypothetical protein